MKMVYLEYFDRPVGISDVPLGVQPLGPQGLHGTLPGGGGPLLPPSGDPPSSCGESRLAGPLAARQRLDSSNGKVGEVEGECACTRYFFNIVADALQAEHFDHRKHFRQGEHCICVGNGLAMSALYPEMRSHQNLFPQAAKLKPCHFGVNESCVKPFSSF